MRLSPDGVSYEAVSHEMFSRGVRDVPRWTFVDLGCGKGRALIFAHEAGFERLIGVEMSGKLAETARKNMRRAGIAAEIANQDASSYRFPDTPLVIFMYNPFGAVTMRQVAEKIKTHSHPVYVVYVTPLHKAALADLEVVHSAAAVVTLFRPANRSRMDAA